MADYYFEETVVKRYCITAESEEDARMMVDWRHEYEEKSKDWELVDVVEEFVISLKVNILGEINWLRLLRK